MARNDDDSPPTPRAIPRPILPQRRDTPPTRPSPARNREQGPMPPKPAAKEVIVPTLASIAGALTVLVGRFDELEKAVLARGSAPPSEVISIPKLALPTPAELLETPAPSSKPESRPSLPARAAKATGDAAKATAKNPIVRWVVWGGALFPWIAQAISWLRGVGVGPIVDGLRLIADALESLAGK